MAGLTDTHCHLNLNLFEDDYAAVLKRAWDAGLERILIPAIDLETSRSAVALCEQDERLYAAVGVHPNDALTWNEDTLDELRALARHPKVCAIGEIGLDYYRDHAPRALQRQILEEQLELAAETGKPVVIHQRESGRDLWPIMHAWRNSLFNAQSALADTPGVFHAFDGDFTEAQAAASDQFFLGMGGPLTYKNALKKQQVAANLPLTHILLETDAPFLAPHPWRGERNEPAYVQKVAEKIAEIRETSYEMIVQITSQNADRLFGWGATL